MATISLKINIVKSNNIKTMQVMTSAVVLQLFVGVHYLGSNGVHHFECVLTTG